MTFRKSAQRYKRVPRFPKRIREPLVQRQANKRCARGGPGPLLDRCQEIAKLIKFAKRNQRFSLSVPLSFTVSYCLFRSLVSSIRRRVLLGQRISGRAIGKLLQTAHRRLCARLLLLLLLLSSLLLFLTRFTDPPQAAFARAFSRFSFSRVIPCDNASLYIRLTAARHDQFR